jgi:hypothetical protein
VTAADVGYRVQHGLFVVHCHRQTPVAGHFAVPVANVDLEKPRATSWTPSVSGWAAVAAVDDQILDLGELLID